MKRPFAFFFSAILFLALFSCDSKKSKTSNYYSVDSLVNAQIKFLSESKVLLTKKAEINGVEESKVFTPKDSSAWAHELDIFAELNAINSPVNAGNYGVENGVRDSTSNLSIRLITAKTALPIVYVKVFYLDALSKIRRVEALYKEENSLLKGSRLLILEFQEINNKTVLVSYSIEGSQQMFIGDAVQFVVKGTIAIQ